MTGLVVEFILQYVQEFSYLGIFLFLIWCGIGFPLPEDAIIIAAGFLIYKGVTNFTMTLLVCFLGVMIGDIIIYYFGKKFGMDILTHKRFQRILSEKRLVRIEKMFNRYGNSIVFLGRFVAFIRAPIYLSAGALGVRFSSFLFYDFIAAILSIPIVVWVGKYFGKEIELALANVRRVEYIITIFVLLIVLYIIRLKRNKKKAKKEANKSDEEQ